MSVKIYGYLNNKFNSFNSRNKWIRGMYAGQVALYGKRKRECRLRRNDDQSIALTHWDTDVLTVYPNGRMEIDVHFKYVTVTTRNLLNDVLRPEAYIGTALHRGCRQQVFSFGPKKYFRFEHALIVIPDGEGGYREEGNLPLLRRVVDREATRETRAMLDDGLKVWLDMSPEMLAVYLRDYEPTPHRRPAVNSWPLALLHARNEEYAAATRSAADACLYGYANVNTPQELQRFIRRRIAQMTIVRRTEEDV